MFNYFPKDAAEVLEFPLGKNIKFPDGYLTLILNLINIKFNKIKKSYQILIFVKNL